MLRFIFSRLLQMIPTLIGVTLVTFLLFNVVGADPALQLAGKNADPETIASLRAELGTDQPLPVQYGQFLKQTLTWDWGESWSKKTSINQLIYDGIGPSLSVTLPAFFLTILISLTLALLSTYFQGRLWDRVITTSCLALMSISFLVYIIFFQKWLAFDINLFPVYGWDPSWIHRWPYVSLSWVIYCLVATGPKMLLFRSALIEESQKDYVRTARAKGVSERRVYTHHVLPNALIPIVTLVIIQIPFLITGSLLLEAFFGIPGVGGLLVESIFNSDFPVVKALTVIGSIAYMLFNLLSDLLYAFLDPRIRLESL